VAKKRQRPNRVQKGDARNKAGTAEGIAVEHKAKAKKGDLGFLKKRKIR